MSRVEVFQESDGRWRWEYRDEKLGLKSNRTYGDEGAARHAARMAYPAHFREPTSPHASGGFIHKIAAVLGIVITILVWRRRDTS
ncbi:MAG: hypothetical protein QOG21_790 [Actinomycetota bacterium]|jgi:hypothetical protein|nr:hypothetical protein [Actinomycetota bacterium]